MLTGYPRGALMELEPATQVTHMLARAAHAAPSADNLQPLRFVHRERTLTLLPRDTTGPTFPRDHPAAYLAAGAALENAMQVAEAMEVGVTAVIPSAVRTSHESSSFPTQAGR
jgi:hypothetical protein